MSNTFRKLTVLVCLNMFAFVLGLLALGEVDPAWKTYSPPMIATGAETLLVSAAPAPHIGDWPKP